MRLSKFGVPLDISLDKEFGTYSLQDQIFYQIKQHILQGHLRAGDFLPPTRILSRQVGVSRGTISSVYKTLAQEGLVSTRVGKGTTVQKLSHSEISSAADSEEFHHKDLIEHSWPGLTDSTYFVQQKIPFALNSPDYETVPGKKWMQLVSRHSRRPWMNNGYSSPHGYGPFRVAIAEFVRKRRGISCSPDQVIAVTNVQQGLALSAQVLFTHGDDVLTENPGFDLHRDALRFFGLNVKPLDMHSGLIDEDFLSEHHPNVKGVLVTPSNQYPLCQVMSINQRNSLLNWAIRQNVWIIEDDFDNEFSYNSRNRLPAIAGLTKDAPVIYLGSFANTVYPGIVIGYMVVPKALVHRFTLAKLFNDRLVSEVHAAIFTDYINQGFFDSHLRRLNRLYNTRKQLLFEEVHAHLKDFGFLIECDQGTHATFIFHKPINDVDFVDFLRTRYRVEARPLSTAYFDGKPVSGLILGFTGFTEEKISKAVTALRQALLSWSAQSFAGEP